MRVVREFLVMIVSAIMAALPGIPMQAFCGSMLDGSAAYTYVLLPSLVVTAKLI